RIVNHPCRPVDEVRDARRDVSRLSRETRQVHPLIHPHFIAIVIGVAVLSKLPVYTPTQISTIGDIDESLTLAAVIAVVIFTDQVSILIKNEIVRIPISVGKDFKVAAVRISPDNHTAVRMLPPLSIGSNPVKSYIANLPVNLSFRSHNGTRHSVSAKTDVDAIAVRYRSFFIDNSIPICITGAPHIGSDTYK